MKRFTLIAAAMALMIGATAAQAEVKIALDGPPDLEKSGSYVWIDAFEKGLRAAGMEVRELPRGAVGGEAEVFDQISTGLLEVSLSDVKSVAKVDELIYGVRLPYIFDDAAHMDRAMDQGGVFAKVNAKLAPVEARLMALVPIGPQSGFITTKATVRTPADLAPLRMRALDDAQIAMYQAWGSSGAIVPWKEVPAALQTGVVDGYLNTPLVPIVFGQTDIVRHFTDAGVINALRAVLVSAAWYDGLSDAERAAVDAAVEAANAANRAWLVGASAGALKQLEDLGVEVVRLSKEQREPFRTLALKTYDSGLLTPENVKFWADLSAATR